RGLPARHRAAHRRRARAGRLLGRICLRQPMGCGCRWQGARSAREPPRDRIAKRTYAAYRSLLDSPGWQRAANGGARPQRLLWASTGTKDPHASDILYVKALAAPFTVNTMPDATLKAFAEHGELSPLLSDGDDGEDVLVRFAEAGIETDALAARLQDEGAKAFVQSWNDLLAVITSKSAMLAKAS